MSSLPIDVEAKLSTKLPLYDETHGGPYDRGGADSYYGRSFDPHYWPEGTQKGTRIEMKDMTPEQITAYTKGYNDNEDAGMFKEW
tara:strand:+ start:2197 stop:2451 length:255 start_codon:yes stop_codon:yes gene_type:complete